MLFLTTAFEKRVSNEKWKKNNNNKNSVWRFDKLSESHYLKQAKNFLAKNTTSYQSQHLGECFRKTQIFTHLQSNVMNHLYVRIFFSVDLTADITRKF